MYIIILKTLCLASVLVQVPCQGKVSPVPEISSNVNLGHLSDTFIHTQDHPYSLNLGSKGINIGHLNIPGICGENMSKFSELKLLPTARENCNLHILGLNETNVKDHVDRSFQS